MPTLAAPSTTFATPVGPMTAVVTATHLVELNFVGEFDPACAAAHGHAMLEGDTTGHSIIERVRTQLDEYFAGMRTEFDLPLAPIGTPFQYAVWNRLQRIPFGATVSYGDLAGDLHKPGAARAVGHANSRNPIAIVIPCHRVIQHNGALGGYAAGLARKQWLLRHEKRIAHH